MTSNARWLFPKFFSANFILGYIWFGLKSKVLCGKNNFMMEIMDKGVTVPKWGLIIQTEISQIPQYLLTDLPNWPKNWGYH